MLAVLVVSILAKAAVVQIDAGADLVVTQLFYDVDQFIQYEKDCRSVGIDCPIIPGMVLLRVTSSSLDSIVSSCVVMPVLLPFHWPSATMKLQLYRGPRTFSQMWPTFGVDDYFAIKFLIFLFILCRHHANHDLWRFQTNDGLLQNEGNHAVCQGHLGEFTFN